MTLRADRRNVSFMVHSRFFAMKKSAPMVAEETSVRIHGVYPLLAGSRLTTNYGDHNDHNDNGNQAACRDAVAP